MGYQLAQAIWDENLDKTKEKCANMSSWNPQAPYEILWRCIDSQ